MKRLFVIVALLATPAMAQNNPPTPPAPVVPLTEYNLKVTLDEANLISDGLQTQPFGRVFPLINKLRQQIVDQQPKPPVDPAKPDVPASEPPK